MAENEDFLMDDSAHEAMAEGIIRALADKGAAIVRRDYSGAPSVGRVVIYRSKIDNGPGNDVFSPAMVIRTRDTPACPPSSTAGARTRASSARHPTRLWST